MTMRALLLTVLGAALLGVLAGALDLSASAFTVAFVAYLAVMLFVFLALPDLRARRHAP